ncbi:MAG TPA: acetyl-CoA carboxylase biotin carboxyl carrier protein [Gemmataceae bacterium]
MSDDARNHPGPFDVQTIEQLIELMSKHDLSEIDLRAGEQRICLRRGVAVPTATPSASTGPVPALAPNPPPKAAETTAAQPQPARQLIDIKSPAVGTFYAQEKPGAPPYVTVGARVTPTTVVCVIEAMKIYNEIPADCSGVIREILVKDKEFVEYGTVLFRVDPNA